MIRIFRVGEVPEEEIFLRNDPVSDVTAPVAEIIARVRREGDSAVLEYTKRFDGAELDCLEVTPREMEIALAEVPQEFLAVMHRAADNIEAYHRHQVRSGFVISERPGVVLGQRVLPLARAGIYVPGGKASYPSTVLMNCIPARLAGVGEIIMVTPPDKSGRIAPQILAAAKIGGADRIFKCGGAQAVAALAYGTETIPPVDKIVGPGNAFVAEAKRQVFGRVAIDMIAGPSEILVIADENSSPRIVAADMLSQAEHDQNATAVLVTVSASLAEKVAAELEAQLSILPRESIARASVDNNGKIIIVGSIEEAIGISNRLAPEHLELCVDDPFSYLNMVQNAGSVFLGRNAPEALGDYFAGPNHTLPTGGTARFSSPLSVDDFVKKSSFTYYSPDALNAVAEDIANFAEREGLSGHARSAVSRKAGDDQ